MTERSLNNDPKSHFQQILLKDRSSYRKKMLQIPQIKGNQPVFFHKQYPQHENFIYQDFKLHYGFIEQSNNPQALIFYFHGMYCHSETSGYLANVIVSKVKNVNIYALDFKNAGLSEGQCPGYYTIESLEDQALKFIEFIEQKFKQNKTKPRIFVMGQSMGGLITFKLCINHPLKFDGAVMLAPALRDCSQNIPVLKCLGKIMGCLCPTFKIIPQDFVGFTRYQNFEYMKKEKGRYIGSHPPGTARSILNQMQNCHKEFNKMQTPYLCIQGGVDKSVDLFAPLDLEKESISKDKTTIYYKELWHDILMQQQIEEISQIIGEWIKKRI